MGKKSNRDVLTLEEKKEKLLYIKVLRAWGKQIGIGQFDISIRLLGCFYRAFGVMFNFISENKLNDEFEKYFIKLDGGYEDLFDIIDSFVKQVEHKIVPKFGE